VCCCFCEGFNITRFVTTEGIVVELFEMKNREERHEVNFNRVGIFHFFFKQMTLKVPLKELKRLAVP